MTAQPDTYTFQKGDDKRREETKKDYISRGWSVEESPPDSSGAITLICTPPKEEQTPLVIPSDSGASGTRATSAGGSSLEPDKLISNLKIRAMLEVLGFTEGTGHDYGKVVNGVVISSPYYPELVGKRNVSVSDLSRHPNITVQVTATLKSTAAGRYQFLKRTWDGLGMPDFTERSQDLAAIKLMLRREMVQPLLSDNLREAVFKGAPEWASLPTEGGGSYYGGQPARTITEIDQKYREALS